MPAAGSDQIRSPSPAAEALPCRFEAPPTPASRRTYRIHFAESRLHLFFMRTGPRRWRSSPSSGGPFRTSPPCREATLLLVVPRQPPLYSEELSTGPFRYAFHLFPLSASPARLQSRRWPFIYFIGECAIPRYFGGLHERLGFLPATIETTGTGAIWFHAVSVGEILSSSN